MPDEPWLMRVEGALEAHFKQPTGQSRPGIDWTIGLKRGEELHRVRVRSCFAEDMRPEVKADTTYLARTVMQSLDDLLRDRLDARAGARPRHHDRQSSAGYEGPIGEAVVAILGIARGVRTRAARSRLSQTCRTGSRLLRAGRPPRPAAPSRPLLLQASRA
jgi:hypothetical protein